MYLICSLLALNPVFTVFDFPILIPLEPSLEPFVIFHFSAVLLIDFRANINFFFELNIS